jgi:NTP pyrophosphatase (non-canonical NTP hydrolase)
VTDFDDIYARCRLVFDADIRSPSEDSWTRLQNRLMAWQTKSYGVANLAVNMTLGIVEELGELAEATTGEAIDDAVADVTIYASQLATCYRLDLGELVRAATADAHSREVKTVVRQPHRHSNYIVAAGRLCHVVLKAAQGIRGMGDPEKARRAVCEALVPVLAECVMSSRGCDAFAYLENVTEVANIVMARKKSALPQVVRP